MTHETIQPDGWLPAKGYANGMLTKDGTLHIGGQIGCCLLYTSPSPRDRQKSRMPSSA